MFDTPTSWRLAGTGLASTALGIVVLVLTAAAPSGAAVWAPVAQLVAAVATFGWILLVAGVLVLSLGGYLIYQETR